MKKKLIYIAAVVCLAAASVYFFPNKSIAATKMGSTPLGLTQTVQANVTSTSVVELPNWHGQSIRELALMVAKNNGDNAPSSIKFIKTTRQKANQFVSKSAVDNDVESYLMIMHGNFTAVNAFGPPGSRPAGHTIAFVVDASNGKVTDFQLNNIDYDLTQLGAPQDL